MTRTGPVRLSCGRLVDDIVAQVAEDRGGDLDEHQQHCPHCQAALAEYDRLWAPVRAVAAQQITAPAHVLETALRRIRGAVEHTDYAVIESPLGVTRIAARVVVVLSREAAQAVPGVRVALSKHLTAAHDGDGPGPTGATEVTAGVTAGVAGRSTAIEITLAADYGQDLLALGDQVRREVANRIRTLTDLEPVSITVVIDDILT